VKLWQSPPGTTLAFESGHEPAVTSLQLSSDAAWLATGGDDNTVRLWKVAEMATLE
jgi:WD40 repeat protein